MTKGWILFLGVLAAGMIQFGILAAVPNTSFMAVAAGTIGAMGTAIAGLLTRLPRDEWTDEQRTSKELNNGQSNEAKN